MIGTTNSAKEAMRFIPPAKIRMAAKATRKPVTHSGMAKAVVTADAIEFDCTMLPMNPSATIRETEKNFARALDPTPFER
ncbi:hypothetical protein SDC9_202700 [bioreactor metagenome]|uniref:Uncharacterized protein n=1 Tax=bioreactor metagenome TaxID=1076179 RepID=A0A645IUD4_9ZZZZ